MIWRPFAGKSESVRLGCTDGEFHVNLATVTIDPTGAPSGDTAQFRAIFAVIMLCASTKWRLLESDEWWRGKLEDVKRMEAECLESDDHASAEDICFHFKQKIEDLSSGMGLGNIRYANIRKLLDRYPDGFVSGGGER